MQTVSLIVPCYKAEPWIDECLVSIHAQIHKDIELIVIDDAQGSGPAAARNRGLDKTTGEFIAFCDADDYMEPHAIERMLVAIEGVDMVAGSFRKFGEFEMTVTHPDAKLSMEAIAKYVIENLKNPRSHQMLSGCWAKLYRRDIIKRYDLSFQKHLTTAEDMAFNFQYLEECRLVRFISDIVYNNRKHKGSLTMRANGEGRPGESGFLEGLKYVKRFLEQFYPEEDIGDALDNSKVYHSMLYFSRVAGTGQETFRKLYP